MYITKTSESLADVGTSQHYTLYSYLMIVSMRKLRDKLQKVTFLLVLSLNGDLKRFFPQYYYVSINLWYYG